MVSGSPRLRPSATLIGSMSPTRSATLVSGVASFSVVGDVGGAADRRGSDRGVRMLAQFGALDHRRPLVEQAGQRPQQPGLALSAFAEQDYVVSGDEGPLQLGNHGIVEAENAGPRIAAIGQRGQQVLPD